ncbi:MAG: TIGR04255 family protein [Chloroflexota bacterium]
MGRRYKNAPIVEALCEFRFDPGSPWDLAIPGLVYEKVRNGFPKRRLVKAFEASISGGPEGIEQQVKTTDRMQFLREDEKALVQVDRHMLAVNHLKPYPTWQEFLPLIRQGFGAYIEVANPKGVQRIGLRYINRIEIPGERIELENYLEFRPFMGSRLPQDFGPFIVGIQVPYENSRDMLRMTLTSAEVMESGKTAFMLDLDYFLAQPGHVTYNDVWRWVDVAHSRVEESFEACITARLRGMFEEVTEK